jgi:transcriptional regulator with XRE-family HTH domain
MPERKRVFRGDRLKDIREKRGYSQDEIAERLQLGDSQINRYEKGKADPSQEVLVRLSRELDVTTDYLLGLTDDPHAHTDEDSLSEDEKRLLDAFRHRNAAEGMKIFSQRLTEN